MLVGRMLMLWCIAGLSSLKPAGKAGARKRSADECFEANSALVTALADGWAEQPGRATKQVKQYDSAGPNLKLLLLLALCQRIKSGEQLPLRPHNDSSLHIQSSLSSCATVGSLAAGRHQHAHVMVSVNACFLLPELLASMMW